MTKVSWSLYINYISIYIVITLHYLWFICFNWDFIFQCVHNNCSLTYNEMLYVIVHILMCCILSPLKMTVKSVESARENKTLWEDNINKGFSFFMEVSFGKVSKYEAPMLGRSRGYSFPKQRLPRSVTPIASSPQFCQKTRRLYSPIFITLLKKKKKFQSDDRNWLLHGS